MVPPSERYVNLGESKARQLVSYRSLSGFITFITAAKQKEGRKEGVSVSVHYHTSNYIPRF